MSVYNLDKYEFVKLVNFEDGPRVGEEDSHVLKQLGDRVDSLSMINISGEATVYRAGRPEINISSGETYMFFKMDSNNP